MKINENPSESMKINENPIESMNKNMCMVYSTSIDHKHMAMSILFRGQEEARLIQQYETHVSGQNSDLCGICREHISSRSGAHQRALARISAHLCALARISAH